MRILYWLLVLLVICLLTDAYLLTHGPQLAEKYKGQRTVVDIVHDFGPNLEKYYDWYNVLLLIFILPLLFQWKHYNKGKFLNEFLQLIIPVFVLRKIGTIFTVQAPTTDRERDHGGKLKQLFFGHSHDLVISGHLCFAISIVLLMFKYNIVSSKLIWGGALVGYGFFSTACRSHYSADILGAFLLAPLVFDIMSNQSATRNVLNLS